MFKTERVTYSHTMNPSIKEELRDFAHYSRESESAIIEKALNAYFESDEGYAKLKEAQAHKKEFIESIKDTLKHPTFFRNREDIIS